MFWFEWKGGKLRCDVDAIVEVTVEVEYEATDEGNGELLSVNASNGGRKMVRIARETLYNLLLHVVAVHTKLAK